MPTYTYRCENCSHEFDHLQVFGEANPQRCPRCGHEHELQRVYKPVGVVFKGSGFYVNDHKSGTRATNGVKPAADTETSSSSNADKTEAAKSETTSPAPADKPEAKPDKPAGKKPAPAAKTD